MAIKCLTAEQQSTQYYFKYTLDDTKVLTETDALGNVTTTPDPSYVREWTYTLTPPQGLTASDYIAMMKRELPLLAQAELDAITTPSPAPTPLSGF